MLSANNSPAVMAFEDGITKAPNSPELDQAHVNAVLTSIGSSLLKPVWRDRWSVDNPTSGYCYIVSEALFHFGGYDDPKPYYISSADGAGAHWFLIDAHGVIIDFTGEQFDKPVDHSQARRGNFYRGSVETKRGLISKRGFIMSQKLGLSD